jgi:hypothetical protein
VSFWADFLKPPLPEVALEANPDLRSMVDWPFPQFVRAVVGMHTADMNTHYAPQSRLLCHDGRPLFDTLLHFESLQKDWQCLRPRFSLPPLPHNHKTEHPPWQEMFTPDLLRVVRSKYAEDFTRFGYETLI